MGMQGSLHDMSVADIIQVNCQDKKTALATIRSAGKEAQLYFRDGNVVHATMESSIGEEVIYNILAWDEGDFNIDLDVESPETTIKRNWSGLLLEGAKRLDELSAEGGLELDLGETPIDQKEDLINGLLQKYLNSVPSVDAVCVVGIDGFVKYSATKNLIDQDVFGATGAAVLNLGKRSLGLLRMDSFSRTVIGGETTTILISVINRYTLLAAIYSQPLHKIQIDWQVIDTLMSDVATLL